jgi:hypothetical protein
VSKDKRSSDIVALLPDKRKNAPPLPAIYILCRKNQARVPAAAEHRENPLKPSEISMQPRVVGPI